MSTVIEAPLPAQTLGTVVCRDASCQNAVSHVSLCECPCTGHGHGSAHRASRERFAALQALRNDDPMRTASAASRRDDQADADMGAIPTRRTPIDFCDACFDVASDCTCEG